MFMVSMKHHRGPLPAPEDFGQYERVLPGSARQIVDMAIRSLDGRIRAGEREQDLADSFQAKDFQEARLGQIFAFIIAMTAILGGIALIAAGHDWPGTTLVGATLLAMVVAFI